MARLFTYGQRKTVIKQNDYLPGQFAGTWGVNLSTDCQIAPDLVIEYGEILQLAKGSLAGNANYTGVRATAQGTLFGVVVRTRDGGIDVDGEFIERPRKFQTLSVFPLGGAQAPFPIAVPLQAEQTPVVGEAAFVAVGTGVEGAARTDDTNGVALTGWVFASGPITPTTGAGRIVLIQKAV